MILKNHFITIAVLISSSLLNACQSDVEIINDQIPAPVVFKLEREWNLSQIEKIPNPSWSGVLHDGSLVVVDRSLYTINHFDAEGNIIQVFGGEGRGPGEFSNITDVTVHPGGKVAVADIRNARITVLNLFDETVSSTDLEPGWHTRLSWNSEKLVITNYPFRIGQSNPGDIIMRKLNLETGEKKEFYHLELEMEDPPFEQISCTFCEFLFQEDHSFFTSPQDTSYRIFRVNLDTGKQTLFSRSGIPAVELTDKEKNERRQELKRGSQLTGISVEELEIPTHKKRFSDFFLDHEGRLWALLHTPASKPFRFDLFNSEAEYIGSMNAPEGFVSVEHVWKDSLLFRFDNAQDDILKLRLYTIKETGTS
ncbi:MAG TPA: hypothetical protein VJ958_02610 [Atribacterota bacterium]|nr:hypothetical protein [Atribacterota bacterium]